MAALISLFCGVMWAKPKPARLALPLVAPYIDMTTAPEMLPVLQASSGINVFTAAFLVGHNGCNPSWGERFPVAADQRIAADITALRQTGGDVILSFGGYNGEELAAVCPSVKSLVKAYQTVLRKYRPRVLDFDIEHTMLDNAASIDRRNQTLHKLQESDPALRVHYTLPVTPAGLPPGAVALLRNAVENGVRVELVNLMAMDFAVPVEEGGMSARAISAVQGARKQIAAVGLETQLGVTPMIGVNDSPGESFTLDDARVLLRYAEAPAHNVELISFWSIARDHGGCSGVVQRSCSGLEQKDWAFTRIFRTFATAAAAGEKR